MLAVHPSAVVTGKRFHGCMNREAEAQKMPNISNIKQQQRYMLVSQAVNKRELIYRHSHQSKEKPSIKLQNYIRKS